MTRTIPVTGASSGIGAACARRFLHEGLQVGLFSVGLFARRAGARTARAVALLALYTGRRDAVFARAGLLTPEPAIDGSGLEAWGGPSP